MVQAAPTEAETHFLLENAKADASVMGVVGWVALQDVDCVRSLDELATCPELLGIRPMLQDMDRIDWLLQPELTPAINRLATHGLCFDALVRPHQLRTIESFASLYPNLSIVLDHAGKPDLARNDIKKWRVELSILAKRQNVSCKLSGMATEASSDWTIEDLRPAFDTLITTFGPSRLLWGSDWPVVNLAGGMDVWWRAAKDLCSLLRKDEQAAIFGGNAARVYSRGAN